MAMSRSGGSRRSGSSRKDRCVTCIHWNCFYWSKSSERSRLELSFLDHVSEFGAFSHDGFRSTKLPTFLETPSPMWRAYASPSLRHMAFLIGVEIVKSTCRMAPLFRPFLFCLFLLKISILIFFPDDPIPPVIPPGIALLSLGTGGASRTIDRPIKISAEA